MYNEQLGQQGNLLFRRPWNRLYFLCITDIIPTSFISKALRQKTAHDSLVDGKGERVLGIELCIMPVARRVA
jgi:hypothetical protein